MNTENFLLLTYKRISPLLYVSVSSGVGMLMQSKLNSSLV